ncbi:hypothetical protein [Dactylosporangium salmoneum]|uniref:Gfo/Idh/MocA-like oxidoreductase N-terminal domain-containing protein n=1 Tax=Dactylosporangium salmoneum TaxID=53361 RepID=A0ABN3HX08_9ACTN
MTGRRTVSTRWCAPATARRHELAALTLGGRLRLAADERADIAVVTASPLLLDQVRSACAAGARTIVLDTPGAARAADVGELADRARGIGLQVVVSWMFADSPLLADLTAPESPALLDSCQLIDPSSDVRAALVEHLVILRRLTAGELRLTAFDEHGYHLTGVADAPAINVSGVVSRLGPAEFTVTAVDPETRWTVRLPADPADIPGRSVRFDATGEQAVRPAYESLLRQRWLALLDAPASDDGLAELATAIRTAGGLVAS